MELLEVENLQVDFETQKGRATILRDLSFSVGEGEAVGLVGESGSGKSVTSLAVLQLLAPNAVVANGSITFQGQNFLTLSESQRAEIRGSQISMIFQDPMSSLNPCYTVEDQICEVLKVHQGLDREQARKRVIELLDLVGIPDPVRRLKNFPHELSGGMSQRVMIAMAIACHPKLVIADEPTTALDVTIQAQILALIRRLRRELKMSLVLVSHDLAVISENTERVLVMYAGEIVEEGPTKEVIEKPKHPYTAGLLNCLPGHYVDTPVDFRLPTIPGMVLNLQQRIDGCQFQERCPRVQADCRRGRIPLDHVAGRGFRCLHPL